MAEPFTTYKLIVLYMAKHSKETLTNSQISEFILDRDYTDYFQLQKVLSELVETELLRKRTISNSSYYEITEEGKKTLSYFEKELSGEIKNEVKDYLQTHGGQVQAVNDNGLTIRMSFPERTKQDEENTDCRG